MIANELKRHNYKSKITVISNGVSNNFKKIEVEKPDKLKDKFIILMIGRYSKEKRQDLIIEAIRKSKYEKNIQLILAGKGPWKEHLKKMSKGLTNKVIFNFYSQDELLKVINYSDLYIHASDAEIEAISCMEAFTCGLVPVISNNKLSATNQFALDDRSLFDAGNSESLREKIEYWIENPEEKKIQSKKYIEYAKQYNIENCVKKMEKIFFN